MEFCIVGTSRSGSTLLRSLLAADRTTAIFNETHWIPVLFKQYGFAAVPVRELYECASKVTWDTGKNLFDVNIKQFSSDPEKARQRLMAYCLSDQAVTIKAFTEKISAIIFDEYPKGGWADKTPDYGCYMGVIQNLWPDCRFIHIVRDGVDTAISMSKHKGCRILQNAGKLSWVDIACNEQYRKFTDKPVALHNYISHWADKIQAVRNESLRLSEGTYLEVSYEALIKTPEKTLQAIFRFLNKPYPGAAAFENILETIHHRSVRQQNIPDQLLPLSLNTLSTLHPTASLNQHSLAPGEAFEGVDRDTLINTRLKRLLEALKRKSGEGIFIQGCGLTTRLWQEDPALAMHWLEQLVDSFNNESQLLEALTVCLTGMFGLPELTDYEDRSLLILCDRLQEQNRKNWLRFVLGIFTVTRRQAVFYIRLMTSGFGPEQEKAIRHVGVKACALFTDNGNIRKTYARRLLGLNYPEEARKILTSIDFVAAGVADTTLLYQIAMATDDGLEAVIHGKTLLSLNPDSPKSHLQLFRAQLAAGLTEHAESTLLLARQRFPESITLHERLVNFYRHWGRGKDMAAAARDLVKLSPQQDHRKLLAMALVRSLAFNELEEVLADLPARDRHHFKAVKFASESRHDMAEHHFLLSVKAGQNPFDLLAFYLRSDQTIKAENWLNEHPNCLDQPQLANIRYRILRLQTGFDAALAYLNRCIEAYPDLPALHISGIELLLWQGRFKAAQMACVTMERRFGETPALQKMKTLLALAFNRQEEALQLISRLESGNLDRQSVMLRCYAGLQQERDEEAENTWQQFVTQNPLPELETALSELHLLSDNLLSVRDNEAILFTVLRNEKPLLPAFFRHYRALGIKNFVVIDNDSTDGSREWLQTQSDVRLYHTGASYKQSCYGIRWVNGLTETLGKGHWCLHVDIDEHLILPQKYGKDLSLFLGTMDQEKALAVTGFMVDMYSETLADGKTFEAGMNPLAVAPFLDNNYRRTQTWHAPFVEVFGGFRQRFVWQGRARGNPLVKTPLIKGGKVSYLSGTHSITPAKVSTACLALLHFKFLGDCQQRFAIEIDRKEHACVQEEYQRYYDAVASTPADQSLLDEHSVRFVDAGQLEKLGIILSGDMSTPVPPLPSENNKKPMPLKLIRNR